MGVAEERPHDLQEGIGPRALREGPQGASILPGHALGIPPVSNVQSP
jgi:hypothetical protein